MQMEVNQNQPQMRGVKETAASFGITEHYARQLALSGKVKAVRASGKGKILLNQQSVADYFNSCFLTSGEPAHADGLKPIQVKI